MTAQPDPNNESPGARALPDRFAAVGADTVGTESVDVEALGAGSVEAESGGRAGVDAVAVAAELGAAGPGEDGAGEGAAVAAEAGDIGAVEGEALEAEPAAAGAVFGDRIDAARRYVQLLAGPGAERGLMGPRERPRLWSRHVLNSAVLADAIPSGLRVVDIGSGAGLPGIPLALARPDLRLDLVESLERRIVFLQEAVAALDLADRVRAVHGRAEEAVAEVGGADAVTARAVAPLGKLARWGAPLLRTGGLFVVLKGASAGDELERDRAACRRAGIVDLAVRQVGGAGGGASATVVVGRRAEASTGTQRRRRR